MQANSLSNLCGKTLDKSRKRIARKIADSVFQVIFWGQRRLFLEEMNHRESGSLACKGISPARMMNTP